MDLTSDKLESCLELQALLEDTENILSLLEISLAVSLSRYGCSLAWLSQFKIVGGDILPRNGRRLLSDFFIDISFIVSRAGNVSVILSWLSASPIVKRSEIQFVM